MSLLSDPISGSSTYVPSTLCGLISLVLHPAMWCTEMERICRTGVSASAPWTVYRKVVPFGSRLAILLCCRSSTVLKNTMRDPILTRGILQHIRRGCQPGAPCVQFDTATRVGGYDPNAVLQHVRELREEGLLQVIDVDTGQNGQVVAIFVRGLTAEGERVLEAES